MNNWEYKLSEFTGSSDALQALVRQEKNQAWEIGALLPSQSLSKGNTGDNPGKDGASASTICIIFKRPLATPASPAALFQ